MFACKRRKNVNFIAEYFLLRKKDIESLNNKEDEMQEKICLSNLYGIDVDINSFYVNNKQNNVNINKQIEIEKENDIDNDIENDTDTETNTYIKEKSERLYPKNTKAKNERIETTDKNGNEQNSNLTDNEYREFFQKKLFLIINKAFFKGKQLKPVTETLLSLIYPPPTLIKQIKY